MDKAGFWKIIDESRAAADGDAEEQLAILGQILRALPPDDIVAFDRHLSTYHARADHWDLWGAAYIIGGGCSDDGFMDFRSWLISRGEKAYEAAMADAESLVDVVQKQDGYCQVEGYQYLATQVWEEKTGEPSDGFPAHDLPKGQDTAGTPWKDADLAQRFPRLSAKFAQR